MGIPETYSRQIPDPWFPRGSRARPHTSVVNCPSLGPIPHASLGVASPHASVVSSSFRQPLLPNRLDVGQGHSGTPNRFGWFARA